MIIKVLLCILYSSGDKEKTSCPSDTGNQLPVPPAQIGKMPNSVKPYKQ